MPQSNTKSIRRKITGAMLVAVLSGAMVALPAISGAQTANAGVVISKINAHRKGKAPVRPRVNPSATSEASGSSTTVSATHTSKADVAREKYRKSREAIHKKAQKVRDAARERYRKIRERYRAWRAAKRDKKIQPVEQKFQAVMDTLSLESNVKVTLVATQRGIRKTRTEFMISKNGSRIDITQGVKLSSVANNISVSEVPSTLAKLIPASSKVQVTEVQVMGIQERTTV
jgi:hypothetical protein